MNIIIKISNDFLLIVVCMFAKSHTFILKPFSPPTILLIWALFMNYVSFKNHVDHRISIFTYTISYI